MTKTVLVIGNVTAKQYACAKYEIFSKGHTPKICRTTYEEFFLDDDALLKKFGSADEQSLADDILGAPSEAESDRIFKHLQNRLEQFAAQQIKDLGELGAVVFDEPSWLKLDGTSRSYVALALSDDEIDDIDLDYTTWVIRPNGVPEYAG